MTKGASTKLRRIASAIGMSTSRAAYITPTTITMAMIVMNLNAGCPMRGSAIWLQQDRMDQPVSPEIGPPKFGHHS
jgi:hypothetical protein